MTDTAHLVTNAALDRLPLFASDLEIAVAIVGKQHASHWKKTMLPALEAHGFPRFDHAHFGRSVHLIKLFYTALHVPQADAVQYRVAAVRSEENRRETEKRWEDYQRERAEKKARSKANADAWKEKKRKALEDFRVKKAASKPCATPNIE
ncbi:MULTISPECIES: hypothetical protein [unclassified Mesorhizobium]|uniref:hypothetical protein n=1 Tax=unclassified Mesorhizobium TaxID=325217 RepID=UPI0011275924|nr:MULTISPECIES: hypothetical protein [unclassified Mesorhizobium]MBZ9699532.1 hypothetical protein [Mesorhizobium sp. CO1-1-3]MBZ9945785.1 hypothetical protein [Mesorhizobium sp. BR1-1-11]TPJ08218.1 hypothetical protein FJ428_07885 [Mesorhizobium sp. B2-8-1]